MKHTSLPALLAISALALTGCGASEVVSDQATSEQSTASSASAEGATQYPLTIENCGTTTVIEHAPERAVSLDQNSTEILLSLGLADRMVGTASWTDPILENLAVDNEKVPRLADNAPTYEVLMDAAPDFVTASFGRHYATGGVVTRDRLAESDIPSYLSPTDCDNGQSINGGGQRTQPLQTDEALFQEIRELAEIFDVTTRGEELIADLQARATAAAEGIASHDATVAFWFADTKTPYIAGGRGAPQFLATSTGLTNAFADQADDWPALTWESVVDANPDLLLLGDLQRDRFPGDRLDDKITFLSEDPLTSSMNAVVNERYITLHGAEMNPSIRYVDGLEKIRAWIDEHADELGN